MVRVIDYRLRNPERGDPKEVHRLVTSLLNEKLYPAKELIPLYHERWEIELSFSELKIRVFDRPRNEPFFRSQRKDGVVQELGATDDHQARGLRRSFDRGLKLNLLCFFTSVLFLGRWRLPFKKAVEGTSNADCQSPGLLFTFHRKSKFRVGGRVRLYVSRAAEPRPVC